VCTVVCTVVCTLPLVALPQNPFFIMLRGSCVPNLEKIGPKLRSKSCPQTDTGHMDMRDLIFCPMLCTQLDRKIQYCIPPTPTRGLQQSHGGSCLRTWLKVTLKNSQINENQHNNNSHSNIKNVRNKACNTLHTARHPLNTFHLFCAENIR